MTVPPFRSRDLVMMSAASSVALSRGRSGSSARSLARRPSPSVARTGHELGHKVPPMSTSAAFKDSAIGRPIIASMVRKRSQEAPY